MGAKEQLEAAQEKQKNLRKSETDKNIFPCKAENKDGTGGFFKNIYFWLLPTSF